MVSGVGLERMSLQFAASIMALVSCRLTPTDEWHFRGHDCHELNVGVEGKVCDEQNLLADVVHVEPWLWSHLPICLHGAFWHSLGHRCGGISDINLGACDVISAAIE